MDLLQTSIERSEYHYQAKLPQKSTQEQKFLSPKVKNPQIKKCIQKLARKKLFGHPYVKRYLYNQYRRGCRPNTIRTNFGAIILFIAHLKGLGRRYLEETTRQDLSSFVEHEQDRGMKPVTVSTRLTSLYAFLDVKGGRG